MLFIAKVLLNVLFSFINLYYFILPDQLNHNDDVKILLDVILILWQMSCNEIKLNIYIKTEFFNIYIKCINIVLIFYLIFIGFQVNIIKVLLIGFQ